MIINRLAIIGLGSIGRRHLRLVSEIRGMMDANDLNGTIIYLLSDISQYVNGQNIIIDDGWIL